MSRTAESADTAFDGAIVVSLDRLLEDLAMPLTSLSPATGRLCKPDARES